LLSKRTDWR